MLRFLIHITLISVFETVFFFLFVSKDEDAGILMATDYYTDAIVGSCSILTRNESAFINSILGRFVNGSAVIRAGVTAAAGREVINAGLMRQSYFYIGGLAGVMTAIATFAVWRRFKIAWIALIWENLVFVTLLGLYEYMFFVTIIKNYNAETPDEISSGFVQGLQRRCGLLLN
jgi:Ca2+/Na+ antiporter